MTQAKRPASSLFQRSALWAALSLSLVGSAQALTLQRPVVQSKQGETLRAEIDIGELTAAEQVELEVRIASPDVYKAARLEVPTINGQPLDLEVQLLRRDHGWPYLKITSKQPITGNFLDLLIDLRWSTGRLLRDVSLSIDDASAKKLITPLMLSESGRNAQASHASVQQRKASDSGQILVKRGDTASELTVGKTPDNVSLEQMLVALLRQNPDAFVSSNVNRMKEGALLTLPTEQEARAVSREEARKAIQVQTKDFEAYRAELAARAPTGTMPKAARDTTGKLEATVKNKNAKTNQDKLTLSKSGNQDAAAEEKIARQREAQEVAERAAELNRNIAELGKIAAATASDAVGNASATHAASGSLPVEVPAQTASSADSEWLNDLRDSSLTPWGAGGLVALLVLIGLWRRHSANKNEADIQGLPPLDVKFNLDLPEFDSKDPAERGYIHEVATHMHEAHEHPHDHTPHADTHAADEEAYTPPRSDIPRPAMAMPNISLDLDEPQASHSPYQVRIDLADELWNLGQLHTSKALMEEVANEASGADKEKALKWLAERG